MWLVELECPKCEKDFEWEWNFDSECDCPHCGHRMELDFDIEYSEEDGDEFIMGPWIVG